MDLAIYFFHNTALGGMGSSNEDRVDSARNQYTARN